MKVAFVRPELKFLDEVSADAVVLGIFDGERPLRGLAGLIDWRLNGLITSWLMDGRFVAQSGEMLLYPDRGRLSFERVVVVGLGRPESYDTESFPVAARQLLRGARDIGARRVAASLPGRHLVNWNPRQVMEAWLSAARDVFMSEPPQPIEVELLIVEDHELQRTVSETVGMFVKRLYHRS